MKEKFMIFLKYFILSFSLFAGFTFSAEEKTEQRQNRARLITQDCRNRSLTPAEARSLAYSRLKYRSLKPVKFVDIRSADILNPFSMPDSVVKSIAEGANINAFGKNGNTLLHLVCDAQNINLALDLIKHGALLLANFQNVFPQDFISSDKLNIDGVEADCLRNILVEEERRYRSEYQKMHTTRVDNKW